MRRVKHRLAYRNRGYLLRRRNGCGMYGRCSRGQVHRSGCGMYGRSSRGQVHRSGCGMYGRSRRVASTDRGRRVVASTDRGMVRDMYRRHGSRRHVTSNRCRGACLRLVHFRKNTSNLIIDGTQTSQHAILHAFFWGGVFTKRAVYFTCTTGHKGSIAIVKRTE